MGEEATLSRLLPVAAIVTGVHVSDWQGAVRAAGELLVATGMTTGAYPEQMRRAVEEHGPYIVLAPGLALAHARPSEAVLRTGLSWVGLATPVRFGHATNDPVRLVVGLAAVDHGSHSAALTRLARMLGEESRMRSLVKATEPDTIHSIICDFEAKEDTR